MVGSRDNTTADPPVQGSPHESEISNNVKTADTLLFSPAGAITGFADRASSQTYLSRTSDGYCYSRTIATADGLLTSVTDGQGCGNGGH